MSKWKYRQIVTQGSATNSPRIGWDLGLFSTITDISIESGTPNDIKLTVAERAATAKIKFSWATSCLFPWNVSELERYCSYALRMVGRWTTG